MRNAHETHLIDWQGRTLEIRYCRSWSEAYERSTGHKLAHLEVEVMQPERSSLPFTETGYRSHFTPAHDIEFAGGPLAYVHTWLDWASQSQEWRERDLAERQYALL